MYWLMRHLLADVTNIHTNTERIWVPTGCTYHIERFILDNEYRLLELH